MVPMTGFGRANSLKNIPVKAKVTRLVKADAGHVKVQGVKYAKSCDC